jgi:hypothetical protein
MRRHTLWPLAAAGLALGGAAMAAGSIAGGGIGALAVGYGLLLVLAAGWLALGLAVHSRVLRRLTPSPAQRRPPGSLLGRRVF